MNFTKAQIRGKLYNSRSLIEGLIKLVETDCIQPDQAAQALKMSIQRELMPNSNVEDTPYSDS